ncbi:MAG: S8 family peptidase [Ferruginibacter sp.]
MTGKQIDRRFIDDIIFGKSKSNNRFTQDSPVYPDVWLDYFDHVKELNTYRCDVILSPHRNTTAAELVKLLFEKLKAGDQGSGSNTGIAGWELASTGESVAVKLTFKELVTKILPLTQFSKKLIPDKDGNFTDSMVWLQELVGAILFAADKKNAAKKIPPGVNAQMKLFSEYFKRSDYFKPGKEDMEDPLVIFSVSKNRKAELAIVKSVPSTKADSGRKVFDIDGSGIIWAVFDTGIDARHEAFRKIDSKTKKIFTNPMSSRAAGGKNNTRVIETYNFTKFRDVLIQGTQNTNTVAAKAGTPKKKTLKNTADTDNKNLTPAESNKLLNEAGIDLQTGRMLDWSVIGPLLKVPQIEGEYIPPAHSHGTHVAGIIGANFNLDSPDGSPPFIGMCPGIGLYDIRVMNDDGTGDEFNILAALQFIRWMNSQRDGIIIHGINLSFSLKHEVASFGCGQTPVCISCNRLVAEGTVVVAAAGNQGQAFFKSLENIDTQGFRTVNITDPGNAESIITVGSTHSNKPHTYGVSYFSSKGPTGDGRFKPDLVAPGEKIESSCVTPGSIVQNATEQRDGTSMAAPHVSGAAALLLAKHRELIGCPKKVKEILCATATDLGREKYFQGCGMIDVLRAIQSV